MTLQRFGLEKVPVHVARDLDPVEARAYRLADNATAAIAEWDAELLPVELEELEALDFDLSLLGFSDEELQEWMAPEPSPGLTDPDAATTQPGDL